MLSLNPVQHKCYILLKMIKKDLIQPFLGEDDVISSYHCKTCLFYAIEGSPSEFWTPENLIACMFRCLNILIDCVQSSNCPNFLMPNSNMFDRIRFRENRERLLQILDELIRFGPNILFRLKIDNIGNALAQGIMFDREHIALQRYNYHMHFLQYPLSFSDAFQEALISMIDLDQSLQFLLQLLDHLQTSCIQDHTETQTQEAFSYIFPWVHQRLAMTYASKAMGINDERTSRQLLSRSDYHFRQGLATDLMNTRLMFVVVLYKLEMYMECEKILDKLDLDLKRHTTSVCCCGDCFKYKGNAELANIITDKNLSLKQTLYREIVSCVKFLPSEANIIPTPLHYEMRRSENTPQGSRDEEAEYWFNWAVVDAKVFLFFMQYLVYTKLGIAYKMNKEVAVEHLEWVMTGGVHHRDTAYNLLGWIYLQEHRLKEALRCWGTSLAIRPKHNAAKFHLSDLMYNIQAAFNG